MGVGPYPTH